MRVSIITTVLNEADSVRPFLASLLNQTRKPDEIVIVDGGSTDGTIEYIESVTRANSSLRLLVEKGCNVARGRNVAIQATSTDYVAMTDAGCAVDTSWLERLIEPFQRDDTIDVVGGWVESDPHTAFERWVSLLQKPFDAIDLEGYHPTARSLAVRKRCWEQVGGFPEDLSMWAEDTVFILRLKEKGFRILITPDAIVYWRPRRNLKEFWMQYFEYGIGEGEARIYPVLFAKRLALCLSTILLAGGFIMPASVIVLAVLILTAAFVRLMMPLKRASMKSWKLFPLFALTVVMETAQAAGYCLGLARGRKSPS
jgi:GT2 family glycosyltransferase